jgi:ABC-type lipoprotein release transport system permease subunit
VVSVGLVIAMLIFGLAATLVPAVRIGRLDPALVLRGS